MQLFVMLQDVYRGLQNNLDVDVVLTDFNKALDNVGQGNLLKRLHEAAMTKNS